MRTTIIFTLGILMATTAGAAGPNYARPHRLAVGLGFGVGSASLSSYHEGVHALTEATRRLNPNVQLSDPTSGLQINAGLSLRYYFPHFILAEVGFATLYNQASEQAKPTSLTLDSHNLVMEVPILVGGYYPLWGRVYLYGAAGPSVFFFSRAYWDPGMDMEAGAGVGMQVQLGADFLVGEHFALGFDVRYRLLPTGELKEQRSGIPVTPRLLGQTGDKPYELDFSGVSATLVLRVFAL